MINETEIKKLDVYLAGKFLIDEEKDLELKQILSEIIEERQKFKELNKKYPNDYELGREIRKLNNTY